MKRLFGLVREHQPHAKIVVGNTLGTSISRIVLEKTAADVCVIGEGEVTFVDLLRALEEGRSLRTVQSIAFRENGEFVQTPERPVIENIDTIPFPDYDLFDMGIYLEASRHLVANPSGLPIPFEQFVAMPVNTARGCPFRCNFCFHAFQEKKYRVRSPANVVAEIRQLKEKYGVNYVNFWDELTFFSMKETERFADALIEADLGVYWIGSCRSELLVRRDGGVEVAKKLRQAKCHGLGFALESGNQGVLSSMNKANTVNEFIEQCHVLQEANVDVYTSIIVGYPQETTATIDDTFEVLKGARVYPSVGFLQLMPATPMYQMAVARGHIKDEEEYLLRMGDRQDLRINMTQYDDQMLMDYVVEKLKELNRELKTSVDESSLIKTKTYYAVEKPKPEGATENFIEGFGVARDVLRKTNWTGKNVEC